MLRVAELIRHAMSDLLSRGDIVDRDGHPLARTIEDARLFLACAQGPDERDIMSLAPPLDLSRPVEADVLEPRPR